MERTSRLLQKLRSRRSVFRSQMQRLKTTTIVLNITLIFFSLSILVVVLSAITYPLWLKMFIALQKITISYAIIIWNVLFCIASISLGVIGIFAIHRKATLILGLQIFALVFLAVLESGILYTILAQWLRHLEVGITFAVQMFQPGSETETVMANIQEALHCCGRGSYGDYGVANEAIPKHYVPYSCCDLQTYTSEHCNNASKLPKSKVASSQSLETNKLIYVIPNELAYKEGCVNRLQNVFLPIVIGCFCLLIFINILVTLISCFYVQKAADEEEIEHNWLDSNDFIKETTEAFCLRQRKPTEIPHHVTDSNFSDLCVFQRQLSRRRTSSLQSNE